MDGAVIGHESASSGCTPFVRFYDEVRGYLGRRMRAEAADDVAQEVFLRLQQRQAEEVVEPRAFVMRVATNAAIDRVRRLGSRGFHESQAPVPAPMPSPVQVVEQREHLERLRSAIAALPQRCREVFLLQRFGGLSYSAIGERLDISTGTVEKHMARALAACRAAVPDYEG